MADRFYRDQVFAYLTQQRAASKRNLLDVLGWLHTGRVCLNDSQRDRFSRELDGILCGVEHTTVKAYRRWKTSHGPLYAPGRREAASEELARICEPRSMYGRDSELVKLYHLEQLPEWLITDGERRPASEHLSRLLLITNELTVRLFAEYDDARVAWHFQAVCYPRGDRFAEYSKADDTVDSRSLNPPCCHLNRLPLFDLGVHGHVSNSDGEVDVIVLGGPTPLVHEGRFDSYGQVIDHLQRTLSCKMSFEERSVTSMALGEHLPPNFPHLPRRFLVY